MAIRIKKWRNLDSGFSLQIHGIADFIGCKFLIIPLIHLRLSTPPPSIPCCGQDGYLAQVPSMKKLKRMNTK